MTEKDIDYDTFTKEFEKNKGKDWREWLEYDESFNKSGKQGLVGIMQLKNKKDAKCIFKLSQYVNYLVQHEGNVMDSLNKIADYCPHFCRSIGRITTDVNSHAKKGDNPFNLNVKYPIKKDVLLCENIDKSKKFTSYIKDKSVNENIIFSAIKQIMMALCISQKAKKFTHYDLHSCNVMMKKCDPNTVFLYVLDEENQFCVPTYGYCPVIIDFGFSHVGDFNGDHAWSSFGFTDIGFTSDRFDSMSDPKLFLVTVSSELKEKRKSENVKIFRNIVKNIFSPLKIDWESGWNDLRMSSASNSVLDFLDTYNTTSDLFKNKGHYLMDILQTLIVLPLKPQKYSDMGIIFGAFLKEWIKIEREFSDNTQCIYIFKCMVDSARSVRDKYSDQKQREKAVDEFTHKMYDTILSISKFCSPKPPKFEVILCSLFVLAKNIEGMLYDIMQKYTKEREKEYKKMPLQTVEKIYAAIESNITSEYTFDEKTTVVVFDCVKQKTFMFKPKPNHIEIINTVLPIYRGTVLYDVYNGKEPEVVLEEDEEDEEDEEEEDSE
jgi:hypothetical protein